MALQRIATLRGHLHRQSCRAESARVVVPGDVVAVTVHGKAEDGTTAGFFPNDKTVFPVCREAVTGDGLGGSRPLQPSLSQTILGMCLKETRTFCVQPGDKEHPQCRRDENLVVEIPNSQDEDLRPGALVQIQYQGRPRLAAVVAINSETSVIVDMNDPLAGKPLFMEVCLRSFDAFEELEQTLFPFDAIDRQHALAVGKLFSRQELTQYNGKTKPETYISVKGLVYDVTAAGRFYGPQGSYSFLSGRDATVALAKFSFNNSLLDRAWTVAPHHADKEGYPEGVDRPYVLSVEELECLSNYVRTFRSKYSIVGYTDTVRVRVGASIKNNISRDQLQNS